VIFFRKEIRHNSEGCRHTNEVYSSQVELRLHQRNSANQNHFFGIHFLCSSVTLCTAESSPVKLQFSLCNILMSRAQFELIHLPEASVYNCTNTCAEI
jgi:hypothetical protein